MGLRIILFLGVFMLAHSAQAATLYMDPASAAINRGDTIEVGVRVDTDEETGECINAVSGVVSYTDSIQPIDISLGNSIFSVWVEPPTINEVDRTITFAGGVPNGYCGRIVGDPRLTNTVVTLIFRSPGLQIGGGEERNVASIDFAPGTTVYLNDGQGTKAPLATYGTKLTLNDRAGSSVDPWLTATREDKIPPEKFSIDLERDEKAFTGKWFIVFNTTDKQTGVDHYEVIEEPLNDLSRFAWGAADAPWIEARSPYVLKDQTLNSTIRVRAVDKAGNEYVATLVPDESLRTPLPLPERYGHTALILIVVLVLCLAGGAVFVALHRRKRAQLLDEGVLNNPNNDNA